MLNPEDLLQSNASAT